MEGKQREKAERLRFGRFFYRFPNGESGADVYDRMTIFEDHLVRDINAGRWSPCSLAAQCAWCMEGSAFGRPLHGIRLRAPQAMYTVWAHMLGSDLISELCPAAGLQDPPEDSRQGARFDGSPWPQCTGWAQPHISGIVPA